jgi:CBS domain-containing protein
MTLLREMPLIAASVPEDAPFLEAARLLLGAHTSAIAVVDADQHVVGSFTDDDLLRGLFPRYLGELHHTAFLIDSADVLQASIQATASEPVSRYMRETETIDIDAAPAHVVERFLHTPWGALAVVDGDRFVGMVGQLEFTERLMARLELPE